MMSEEVLTTDMLIRSESTSRHPLRRPKTFMKIETFTFDFHECAYTFLHIKSADWSLINESESAEFVNFAAVSQEQLNDFFRHSRESWLTSTGAPAVNLQ
jgi:hypothetical protein